MFLTVRHLGRSVLACVALLAFAVGCGGTGESEQPTPVVVPTVAQAPQLPVRLAEIVTPTPRPSAPDPSPTPETAGTPEAGYKPESNMYRFFSRVNHPVKVALEGLERARTHNDKTQVPIILEVLRFFPSQQFQQDALETLNHLTEQPPEGQEWTWNQWMTWLWANSSDYPVPEKYATWKSVFLSGGIDQRYREFLPPDGKVAPDIDLLQLIWGGVAPDQTPPLVDPDVITVEEADYLLADDRVFGVSIDGEHRAYPLRITNVHEIVNDEIAGRPIVLAQCVLCGSGAIYSAEVGGGKTLFGTSGLIYKSNPVMYDLENRSLWHHFTGGAVAGSAADPGSALEPIPSVVTTWKEWSTLHPDTTVLSVLNEIYPPQAYVPESTPGSPLETYLNTDETVFPLWPQSEALGRKESVLGVRAGEEAKAYPVGVLQERRVVNDKVGGTPIVIVASSETEAARAYERGSVSLALGDDEEAGTPSKVVDADGGEWKVTEEALVNEESGEELPRIPGQIALWMSWYAFFPDTGLEKASPQ